MMLNNIFIIAKYTSKEILQSKILLNVLLLGLAMAGVIFVAFNFTYGEVSRVALNFGLSSLSLSSVGIAFFMGVTLISREIENRTVYMIISRPVSRSQFIIGKILGLMGVLFINILLLSLLTLLCYGLIGGEFYSTIFAAIIMTMLECVVVLLMICFFSLITTQTLTVLFSLSLYVTGHAISEAKLTTFAMKREFVSWVLEGYQFVLPAFAKFNIKDFVVYQKSLDISYFFNTTLYGVFYSLFLLFLILLIFEKKNLD